MPIIMCDLIANRLSPFRKCMCLQMTWLGTFPMSIGLGKFYHFLYEWTVETGMNQLRYMLPYSVIVNVENS